MTAPPRTAGSSAHEKIQVRVEDRESHTATYMLSELVELVVVDQNMVFDAETLAQLRKVVGAREECGRRRHDQWPKLEGVDFPIQGRVEKKNACPQLFHKVTKMERAEKEDAMVEIATLAATSLNGGDLRQMATELIDILVMTVKDDALTIIQEITNFNGVEAWRRVVARYAFMRVMSPQKLKELKDLRSAIQQFSDIIVAVEVLCRVLILSSRNRDSSHRDTLNVHLRAFMLCQTWVQLLAWSAKSA